MPRATLPHPQRERGLVGGEEGFEWPPKVSIGESPSALSKLAALIEEHDHNELWDFVADNVVERLRASFGPLAARGPSEPELKPRARCETQSPAVRKQLRLAQALELPVRPGPLRHSAEKPAPAQPIQWLIQPQGLATAPPPAEQPGRHPAPMPARELRLLGVPWDWDFNSLTCVFKSIGLCMHCDVGMVEWEGEGKVLVKLKSDVAAQKCLELDSFVVRDGATERPLHVAPAAAALTAAAAPAAAAEPPAHGPACPAAEHAAKEEAASVQISKIEAVQNEDSSLRLCTDAAMDTLSGPYSKASIAKIAESFLLDALGKSGPVGEKGGRPGLQPSVGKQVWADMCEGGPDAEDVLQALLK